MRHLVMRCVIERTLLLAVLVPLPPSAALAHPASGIVVDAAGNIYFIQTGTGVAKIDRQGKLTFIHKVTGGGHFLALDSQGKFSTQFPRLFERLALEGSNKALLYASGGAPLVCNRDGNLYYASGYPGGDDRAPSGLTLTRLSPDGKKTLFAPGLKASLAKLNEAVTGLVNGPDGSLFVACPNAILKVKTDGTVARLVHPVAVKEPFIMDAAKDPTSPYFHAPYLRGLDVAADEMIYAAVNGCSSVVKITQDGKVETILTSEPPWSPTAVALHGKDLYVLEYTNTEKPKEWFPRVRKLAPDGQVTVLATLWPGEQHRSAVPNKFAPYAADPEHLWNRVHQALFVRTASDGSQQVHTTDPLLWHGRTTQHNGTFFFGTFHLLEGDSHQRAIEGLDRFLAEHAERLIDDPLERFFFQHDLWAAFDYVAWYPDEWVYHSRHEPAAIALRTRLATMIGRLALSDREIAALPNNYAEAAKSKQYPAEHDPNNPQRHFLPPDLFDEAGPWVRFHEAGADPMVRDHFRGAGGRAVHVIFLRLPGGRATTEKYLEELAHDQIQQFPSGTMVAMVRHPLTVDQSAKVRVTPLTELVQIRVYRQIPPGEVATRGDDFSQQDVYEFVLDRGKLFAGEHDLRAVGPDDPAESFTRDVGDDPFDPKFDHPVSPTTQLKTCVSCHQQPGVYSVNSMTHALFGKPKGAFRTYAWDVEMRYSVAQKSSSFNGACCKAC